VVNLEHAQASGTIGGTLGGKTALKTEPAYLKTFFALTTLVAAILMTVNALASG